MRAWVVACFGVALAFLPSAEAGTRERPEVTDDEGDTGQPAALGADILSAWVHDDNATSFKVTVEAATINDPELATYQFHFRVGHRGLWILRAEWRTGATQYDLRSTDVNTPRAVPGEIHPGSPGQITWTVPLDFIGAGPGSVVGRFGTQSSNDASPVLPAHDEASGGDARFQLGLAGLLEPFPAPSGPPTFYLGNMTTKTPIDLQGLWIQNGTDTVDFIVSSATLDPVDAPTCHLQIHVLVYSSIYEKGMVSFHLEAVFGPNRTAGVEVLDGNASLQQPPLGRQGGAYRNTYLPTAIHLGSPGYFRTQVPANLWSEAEDPWSMQVSAGGHGEGCGADDVRDSFDYSPYHDDFIPTVGLSPALLGVGAMILARGARRARP